MIIIALVVVLLIIFWPRWWVKRVLHIHNQSRDDLSGTGGELAQHLKERFKLDIDIKAEGPDSYNPVDKTVRLSEEYFNQKSLTAVAVAAHEVGHAIQHQQNYGPLASRHKIVITSFYLQKLVSFALLVSPFVGIFALGPVIIKLVVALAVFGALVGLLAHLITLPVEFDASFNRALPILQQGQYVSDQDLKIIRKILLACALTYVSAALMNVLNLGYWFRVLRR